MVCFLALFSLPRRSVFFSSVCSAFFRRVSCRTVRIGGEHSFVGFKSQPDRVSRRCSLIVRVASPAMRSLSLHRRAQTNTVCRNLVTVVSNGIELRRRSWLTVHNLGLRQRFGQNKRSRTFVAEVSATFFYSFGGHGFLERRPFNRSTTSQLGT